MSALTFFFKLLPYIWPFLKDMILGRKTFLEALRDNKKKALLVIVIIFSFGLNFFLVPRTTRMAMDYIALDKKYKEIVMKCNFVPGTQKHTISQGTEVKKPVPTLEEHVDIPTPPMVQLKNPAKTVKKKPEIVRPHVEHPSVDEVKNTYDDILKREQGQ
jgi:hypothetical protein